MMSPNDDILGMPTIADFCAFRCSLTLLHGRRALTSRESIQLCAARIEVGMVGVNVGVAAPMAFFPFTGWKNSFFGDLHAHGKDAVRFYTEQTVIMTRRF